MDRSEPVKVLYIIDRFLNPYAGTEGQLYSLIKGLDKAQYQPELLVLQSSEYVEKGGDLSCPVYVLGGSRLGSPLTWIRMLRVARQRKREGVRLVHVFFNDSSILAPPIFSLLRIPVIISRRDMGYWYTPGYLRVLRATSRWVSRVIVNSEAVKRVTSESEGYPPDVIDVVYNGYADKSASSTTALPAVSGCKIALVANIRPVKRIQDAIEAMNSVVKFDQNVTLYIVGGGDPSELIEHAQDCKVSDNVRFLGSRSDVKSILEQMDVGILCSESEGYSNAIVEYMHAGLPVVASDVGGNSEAVLDGQTGYLYPVGDVDGLASRIISFFTNQERAKEMGRLGREFAINRHSPEAMIENHNRIYASVLGRSGKSLGGGHR